MRLNIIIIIFTSLIIIIPFIIIVRIITEEINVGRLNKAKIELLRSNWSIIKCSDRLTTIASALEWIIVIIITIVSLIIHEITWGHGGEMGVRPKSPYIPPKKG